MEFGDGPRTQTCPQTSEEVLAAHPWGIHGSLVLPVLRSGTPCKCNKTEAWRAHPSSQKPAGRMGPSPPPCSAPCWQNRRELQTRWPQHHKAESRRGPLDMNFPAGAGLLSRI